VALRRNALPQADSKDSLKRTFRSRRAHQSSIDDPLKAAIHFLRLDEVLSLFGDIAAGLDFLHSNGVLHLDLKADNVLLHFHGEDAPLPLAMLSDFGSSESTQRLRTRERTGCTGTIGYVAPEVFSVDPKTGRYRDLAASADLWALGLLLHLLCYFRLPFANEDDLDLLKREIEGYPGFLSAKHPRFDIPSGLDLLMARLINCKPSARPSAAQVLKSLAELDLSQVPANGVLVRRSSSSNDLSPVLGGGAASQNLVRAAATLSDLAQLSWAPTARRASYGASAALKVRLSAVLGQTG
jgi:serine/threonine protein kinase